MRPGNFSISLLLLLFACPGEVSSQNALADTDGDALLDSWEVNGYERNGFLEPLPAYGADPSKKDVFVEIDWMASAEGSQVNALIAYQAAVDVTRVFCRSGTDIRIHFDLGPRIESLLPPGALAPDVHFSEFQDEPDAEKVLPYQDRFPARPSCSVPSSTLTLYDVYYGGRYFRPSRRNIFYYVIFAEQKEPPDEAAQAGDVLRNHPFSESFSDELARRDGLRDAGVQISVIFRRPTPDISPDLLRYQYSVSLLHELGHAFGLGHGGALSGFRWDNTNYKPNYPSIMNYRFQTCGVDFASEVPTCGGGFAFGAPVMDFSRGLNLDLSEKSLLEPVGVGTTLPNERVLKCGELNHLIGTDFPSNIDWNKDGKISNRPIATDINKNNRIDDAALKDHDDWGKFLRDGFDGIGLHAYRNCGLGCGVGEEVIRVAGDFNGDRLTDLFLQRGEEAAWALSSGDRKLVIDSRAHLQESIGSWALLGGGTFFAGRFFGKDHDMIFAHRGKDVAIIDYNDGSPRLYWFEDFEVRGLGAEAGGGWKIGASDRFLGINLSGNASMDLAVTNGLDVAVLTAQTSDSPSMLLAWSAGSALSAWMGGETPSISAGRDIEDVEGASSLLVSSASHLVEIAAPLSAASATSLDRDGLIPSIGPPVLDWALSSDDCILPIDLDGDGAQELFLRRRDRVAVVRWKDGLPFVVWSASGQIQDVWLLSEQDRVYHGRFLPGVGEEVLLSNGTGMTVLGWDKASSSLKILGTNNGYLREEPATWQLRRGQVILPGHFLPGEPDLLLIQDNSRFVLAKLELASPAGFTPLVKVNGKLDNWLLKPEDVFLLANVDEDPESEALVRRGNLLCVLDFSPGPRCTFTGRLDTEKLQFRPEPKFVRGDANGDGEVDISDVVAVLGALFLFDGFKGSHCEDAADANDSGVIEVSDPIYILSFLFNKGVAPPPPGPYVPGEDPTPDTLECN